jgi:hypothetical protein
MVTPHAPGPRDHHVHMPLAGETLRIEWLEHAAAMVLVKPDHFDCDTVR